MPWSPAVWDDFSAVGLALFTCAAFIISIARGWLIPGRHHREIVEGKNAAIADLRESAKVDGDTINIQARTIAARDAVEDTATRLLEAFRDAAEGGGH